MNNAWDLPFAAWNRDLKCEFVKWLVDTYGDKGAHQYFNEFRAVKDVMASVEPKYDTNPYTDVLAHSMLHTKEVLAAGIMKKLWGNDANN